MSEKLFFSQDIIDSWTDDDKVSFENETLFINSPQGRQEYRLTIAYRFVQVSDAGPDPHGVVGKVFSDDELAAKSADVYLNSCIIGETPYDVETGYVAIKQEDEQNINDLLMEYLAKTLI